MECDNHTLVCKAPVSSGTKYILTKVSTFSELGGRISSLASMTVTTNSTPSSVKVFLEV